MESLLLFRTEPRSKLVSSQTLKVPITTSYSTQNFHFYPFTIFCHVFRCFPECLGTGPSLWNSVQRTFHSPRWDTVSLLRFWMFLSSCCIKMGLSENRVPVNLMNIDYRLSIDCIIIISTKVDMWGGNTTCSNTHQLSIFILDYIKDVPFLSPCLITISMVRQTHIIIWPSRKLT